LFADKQRLHNPYEWAELQDSIKSRYTIDADRIMFDALLAGASIEEAVEIATDYEGETETEETEVELF
jgi:predicted component of type VI protein secretion system